MSYEASNAEVEITSSSLFLRSAVHEPDQQDNSNLMRSGKRVRPSAYQQSKTKPFKEERVRWYWSAKYVGFSFSKDQQQRNPPIKTIKLKQTSLH